MNGPLKNATVCLDKNLNYSCDANEPAGKTDASGKATLNVDNADLGKYPLLAVVGTDAVDADTGQVPVAFTLKAPADQTGVVSPLTTLVQAQVEATGVSSTEAAKSIQQQLGLTTSPLADFTQDGTAAGKQTGTLARLVVVTQQTQLGDTAGALGTDGTALNSAQISAAIQAQLLQQLQTLATAVLDNPTLADSGKSVADKQAAITAAARRWQTLPA